MSGAIAILGGTGAEGRGLALRFGLGGRPVIIGSRQAERAEAVAAEVNAALSRQAATGAANPDAAAAAEAIVLTVPYAGLAETAQALGGAADGKPVISAVAPLVFGPGGPETVPIPEGSAAQRLQALLPAARVVGAFHHLSAVTLAEISQAVDVDVLVCGDDPAAKQVALELIGLLPGARGIDAGPLAVAGHLEAFTAVLLRINRHYRAHAGIRITHLPAPSK